MVLRMPDHHAANKCPCRDERDRDDQLQDIEVAHDGSTCINGTRAFGMPELQLKRRGRLGSIRPGRPRDCTASLIVAVCGTIATTPPVVLSRHRPAGWILARGQVSLPATNRQHVGLILPHGAHPARHFYQNAARLAALRRRLRLLRGRGWLTAFTAGNRSDG